VSLRPGLFPPFSILCPHSDPAILSNWN
jgi:hypothetical protein